MIELFVSNKYTRWYSLIISAARQRSPTPGLYLERHHIIPKCIGGTDEPVNIVPLTAREHFICHWLLTKMVTDVHHSYKMKHALGRFVQSSNLQNRNMSSRQYEIARKSISEARKGRRHTAESRKKMSIARKGRPSRNKGRTEWFKQTPEAKQRISAANKGKTFAERFGEEGAKSAIEKMKASKRGKPSGMLGKKHSQETIQKLSKPKNGSPHIRQTCPHCLVVDQTPRHIKFCGKNFDPTGSISG